MNFRVGACALLVCLAGCSAEAPETQSGVASLGASSQRQGQKLPTVQVDRKAPESVANAPDRGALIQYKNKGIATRQEGAYTWYPIAMSEAHAIKAVVTGEMNVPAPDGSQIKLKYERHEEQTDGNWTWIGHVVGGDQRQDAILTFGEKAVFGTIPQASGTRLNVQTRGGALFVVQTDPSKVKNPNVADTDMMMPPALALRSKLLASAPADKAAEFSSSKAGISATTVDVAIGYTQGFASMPGGQSAAVTRVVNLVAIGNAAFKNSLITGTLRVVHAVQVSYPDNTSNQAALEELTGVRNRQPITVPAGLVPLRTARDQYGADIAILVRKFQAPENEGCGIAWLNGAGQEPINPSVDDDYAFAVVSDGDDADGNNNYFCAPESLVHEVGHLMGSAHDRDNSKIRPNDPPGGSNLLYGRYPYSFGMKTSAANGNFLTIMSYGEEGMNFNPVFSSPLVRKCGPTNANLPCGVANQTDNARSLNQTLPVVARFRATVVAFGSPGRPYAGRAYDVNADGRADLIWHGQSLKKMQPWLMNGTAWTYGTARTIASEYYVVGVGDFNNDGRADILWRDATKLWQWRAKPDGSYESVFLRAWPAGWDIVGVGDANADGRSDIFWHNQTAGQLQVWFMNGTAFTYSPVRSLASTYRVVGVGDFNNDKRADILWADDLLLWQWQATSAGTYNAIYLRPYPTGWSVVGVDDANADGRADIFWHNKYAGSIQSWLMNGGSFTYGRTDKIGSQYDVLSIGDFDNDNRADIVWADASKLWQWKSSASGTYTSVYLRPYPSGYQQVN